MEQKKNPEMLTENPFYILRTTASVDDKTLLEKISEVYLLTGKDVSQEANSLMQPTGRLKAEIAFLPCMGEKEVDEIRTCLEDPSSDLPSFEGADPLAKLNAVCALLEAWPAEDCEGTAALCLSIAGVYAAVDPSSVRDALSVDRKAAGKGMTESLSVIKKRLSDHQKAILERIGERAALLPEAEMQALIQKLADVFADHENPLHLSLFLNLLVRYHLVPLQKQKIIEQETRIQECIQIYKESMEKSPQDRKKADDCCRNLLDALNCWHRLSLPERRILLAQGIHSAESRDLKRQLFSGVILMVDTHHDIKNAVSVLRNMLDVFLDLPEEERKSLEDVARIFHIR